MEPNGHVFHDLARVQALEGMELTARRPNWQLMVDKLTGMKISAFYKAKSSIYEPTCERVSKLGK